MDAAETERFLDDVSAVMRSLVDAATAPLVARIATLEKSLSEMPVPRDGKDGKDGKDGRDGATAGEIAGMVREMVEALPPPTYGKSVTLDDAAPLIKAAVAEEVAALPPPKAGENGRDGENGKDADPEVMKAAIAEAVAALPKPQDGKSVTAEELRPIIDECVSKAVSALPKPKDGVGLAGALIDRGGNLVVTMTDGTTRELGVVVGKDGEPGADGRDGFSADDFEAEYDGERALTLRFYRDGAVVKSIPLKLPIPIYRGVFKSGAAYERGDSVTWGGSAFIAMVDAPDNAPAETKDWCLSTKRGRDGREAVPIQRDPKAPVKLGEGEK